MSEFVWYNPTTWFDSGPSSMDYTYGGTQFSDGLTSNLTPEAYANWMGSTTGYDYDPYNAFLGSGGWGSTPYNTIQTPSITDDLYKELGGLKGVASLGLGGLSMLLNEKSRRDQLEQARDQANALLGFKNRELEAGQSEDLAKTEAMMNLLNQRGRVKLDPRRYAEIVASGAIPADVLATREMVDVAAAPREFRRGGLGLLRGGTTGQADTINARLSDGEYVMDADVVAALGDGNTEAGAARLDEMREAVRRHKRSASAKDIPPPAKHPLAYMSKKGARK